MRVAQAYLTPRFAAAPDWGAYASVSSHGKAVGDAKLTSDGKTDKVVGKVQNAIGGIKDALKQ